jgi:copper chaperone CopZ
VPTTETFAVTGMTCGHCAASVTEELTALPGVRSVDVDLNVGADSAVTVTSDSPLSHAQVAAAVAEAGYRLAGA